MNLLRSFSPIALVALCTTSHAQQNCPPPTAFEQLDINNVRANYYNSGLDWTDSPHSSSGYEIPINSGRHSIFGGSTWIGGLNEQGELRITGRMHRYSDLEFVFWPGPMNNTTPGSFISASCSDYNHIYKIDRSQVVLHRLYYQMFSENGGIPPTDPPFENGYSIPEEILNWPSHTEVIPGQPQQLAPFFDNDCCGGTPGIYEPELGDYPAFRFPDNEGEFDCEKHLLGDQVLWWVTHNAYNNLPGSEDNEFEPTGFEFHNMAYAYISDDHLKNTSFLRRTVINRSGWEYENVYIGQFIDVDLGGPNDDFFGNDVERGMAYYYNGDNNDQDDGGALGYGVSPPAIGFTWVGGPLADENDGIDNNFDGIVDEPGERLRMYHSMYMMNSSASTGLPVVPLHFYNYLQGKWRNGTTLTHGGIGYNPQSADTIPCLIAFPGDSDPLLINTHGIEMDPWSEITEGNPPGDRRNIMSSGPFTFLPDEEKVFTMAIPWARQEDCIEAPCSLELLREANDLAQELHDNCYELPCMVLDAEFEIEIENGSAFLSSPITSGIEYHWTFGDGEAMTTAFPFASHQYTQADNYSVCLEIDFGCGTSSTCMAVGGLLCDLMTGPELTQIEGTGNTHHYFELTDETIEAIWQNDSNMVIHPTNKKGKGPVKVLAYDFDNLVDGDYTLMFDSTHAEAHWKMFIQGTIDTVHSELPIGVSNAQYIEQWGLMVSVDAHMSEDVSMPIGASLQFADESIPWLSHLSDTDDLTYKNWIREGTTYTLCPPDVFSNCYYMDEEQTQLHPCFFNDRSFSTPDESFEKLINGGWAPSHFVPFYNCQPRLNGGQYSGQLFNKPGQVRNVDLVFTSDKTLWTRSPVIDLRYGDDVDQLVRLRDELSVDKNGLNQNHPECNIAEATLNGEQVESDGLSYGMGWFPGYAIDVNTGKRLNIVFGENPDLVDDNGNDMIWNPTSTISQPGNIANFGGMHSITILSNYIASPMSPQYDHGTSIAEFINSSAYPIYRNFQRQQQWTGLPILNEGFELLPIEEGLIPTKTTIQLRLRHRCQNYLPGEVNINNGNPLYNFTIDYEDLISNVEEMKEEQKILVYPNPTRDLLYVQLSGFEQQPQELQIFSLSGSLVKRVAVNQINQIAIDTSNLPSGMYIIRTQSPETGNAHYNRFAVVR